MRYIQTNYTKIHPKIREVIINIDHETRKIQIHKKYQIKRLFLETQFDILETIIQNIS